MDNYLTPNAAPTGAEFLAAVTECAALARSAPPAPQGAAFVRWFLHHDACATRCERVIVDWLVAYVPVALLRSALDTLAECASFDADGDAR